MDHLTEFVDQRHKAWCIHCGRGNADLRTNKDHVPSKSLLDRPYPPELPTVEICADCNSSFSEDEEYVAAFIGALLSGSTDPGRQKTTGGARILQNNSALRKRIDGSRTISSTLFGEQTTTWYPEIQRFRKAIVKNARGHVYFELGQPAFGEPAGVRLTPLEKLSKDERSDFELIDHGPGFPEVGSRMLTRLLTGQDMKNGWTVVQHNVYRYAAVENSGFSVRIVIREFLAAEVWWNLD